MEIAATADADAAEGLIGLAVRGDESAFAAIVRRYHTDMVRVSFVVAGDYTLAEDAVMNAWPIAWRRLGSLREPDRLRSWLCSIAANEARQLVRSRRRRNVREIAVNADVGTIADASVSFADIDLRNALAQLSPDDRNFAGPSLRRRAQLD